MVHVKKEYDATEVYNATRKAIGCPEYIEGDIIIKCKSTVEYDKFVFEQGTKLLFIGHPYTDKGNPVVKVCPEYNSGLCVRPKFIIDNFKYLSEDTSKLHSLNEYNGVIGFLKHKVNLNQSIQSAHAILGLLFCFLVIFSPFAVISIFTDCSVLGAIWVFVTLIFGVIFKYIDMRIDDYYKSIKSLKNYIRVSVNEILSDTNDNSIAFHNVKGDLL